MPVDQRFLECLFEPDDLVEVRLLPSRRSMFRCAGQLHELAGELARDNAGGENVFVGVNPRRRQGGTGADVAYARCLFVDVDGVAPEAAAQRVSDAGLPTPTCTVASGHGLHAYWRLAEPMSDLRSWTSAQKHLIRLLNSDKAIHDPPRIMRLPSFWNHRPPRAPCAVIDADPQRRYAVGQLVALGDDPEQVARLWLQRALRRAAPGNRNVMGLWLACQLRDAGLDQRRAEATLRAYAQALGGGYTADEALRTARSAYSRPAREPATASGQPAPDPPLIPLIEQDLPDIPADVLPDWARDFALELSEAKETPPALAILLQLATMASCVQRAFCVQLEPAYTETLCIFAAPALDSGERKTAIHGPIVAPLFAFQKTLREQAQAELQGVAIKRRLIEQQIKALERAHLRADPAGRRDIEQQIAALVGQLPPVRGLPQLIAEDFTEAALGTALAANGESLLVTSDEGGLFDNLSGRHSDISEIDLFLKSHAGSPHTVNRIGRDNLFLRRPLLSVAISPQPAVLARLAAKDGFIGRGLTARFLWALPKSRVGSRTLEPAKVNVYATQAYHNAIVAMARVGYGHDGPPARLQLHADAYAVWKPFERELEPRIGPEGDLRQIKAWVSKLPGAVARIAAVCHVGEHLERAVDTPVSAATMTAAIELGRALIPHSVAAHRLMGGGGFHVAQAVVAHYGSAGWPRQTQTLTAWWRPVRRVVGDTSRLFEPVAQILADHGYLIPVQVGPGRRGVQYRANSSLIVRVNAA